MALPVSTCLAGRSLRVDGKHAAFSAVLTVLQALSQSAAWLVAIWKILHAAQSQGGGAFPDRRDPLGVVCARPLAYRPGSSRRAVGDHLALGGSAQRQ